MSIKNLIFQNQNKLVFRKNKYAEKKISKTQPKKEHSPKPDNKAPLSQKTTFTG